MRKFFPLGIKAKLFILRQVIQTPQTSRGGFIPVMRKPFVPSGGGSAQPLLNIVTTENMVMHYLESRGTSPKASPSGDHLRQESYTHTYTTHLIELQQPESLVRSQLRCTKLELPDVPSPRGIPLCLKLGCNCKLSKYPKNPAASRHCFELDMRY